MGVEGLGFINPYVFRSIPSVSNGVEHDPAYDKL
jgi:hypothetical protein